MKNDKENTLYGNSVPMENNSRLDYKKKIPFPWLNSSENSFRAYIRSSAKNKYHIYRCMREFWFCRANSLPLLLLKYKLLYLLSISYDWFRYLKTKRGEKGLSLSFVSFEINVGRSTILKGFYRERYLIRL